MRSIWAVILVVVAGAASVARAADRAEETQALRDIAEAGRARNEQIRRNQAATNADFRARYEAAERDLKEIDQDQELRKALRETGEEIPLGTSGNRELTMTGHGLYVDTVKSKNRRTVVWAVGTFVTPEETIKSRKARVAGFGIPFFSQGVW